MAMRARSDNAKSSSDERMEEWQMALLLFSGFLAISALYLLTGTAC